MPKKGELASAQRLQEKIAKQYPGEEAVAVILRLYKGDPQAGVKPLGTKHIARRFETSDKTIKGLIPPESRRDRGENGRINHEFSDQTVNTSGLAAHNAALQADRQRRLEQAERAIQAGIDPEFAMRRYHLERQAVGNMVRKHRGNGRLTRLDRSGIQSKIWSAEIMDRLIGWQGSELDQDIIMRRILVAQRVDRLTLREIAEKHGYDLATIGNRERAILEAVGVLQRKTTAGIKEQTA